MFEQNPTILDQTAGQAGAFLLQSELKIDVLHVPEDCEKKGQNGDTLIFDYEAGINGEIIESSKMTGNEEEDQDKEPLVVPIGRKAVIPGLESGVQQMCIGEKRKIVIPPHLAFGAKGVPGVVPENAYITFVVELTEIVPKGWGEWYVEMVWMACYVSFLGGIIAIMYQKVQERKLDRKKKKTRTDYDDYENDHED
ncbi:hypothetical protein FSP39_015444 [Pinctada imbricata]|uniref:peptidylprolyl isomerase n=1 Tax=Pinctada imbricata TaxID=66713 RepID=A0AA88Y0R5_PINIB|nr:hypothetical protein FSP39_015444 [Pinctada imbricata]